jgi:peptide/nickel transport system permease protein
MKDKKPVLALLILVFVIMMMPVLFSAQLFSHIHNLNIKETLAPPGKNHLFGTDNLGRDLFERTFSALKTSLALALAIQILSLTVGSIIGSTAAYFGGIADRVYILIQNVLMSFPSIIASLCLIAMIGPGINALILALSALEWVSYARIIRSETLVLKEADFVLSARSIGATNIYILFVHILPNVIRPVIPLFTLMIGHTTLSIAGLGFLGFGIQPPAPEIGLMIRDGITYMSLAPWMILFPGLMLSVYVLYINLLGDELRDWFNPRKELAAG